MSTPITRPPGAPEPPQPDGDDYSAAFAAWAVMVTSLVLAALVLVLWALADL